MVQFRLKRGEAFLAGLYGHFGLFAVDPGEILRGEGVVGTFCLALDLTDSPPEWRMFRVRRVSRFLCFPSPRVMPQITSMSVEIAAINPSVAETQSSAKSAFAKLFGIGVGSWIAATVVVFAASWKITHPESVPSAFMWTMTHWWIAFVFGLLVMAGYGLMKKLPVGRAMMAYSLPVLILVVLAALCLAIYPDNGFRVEFSTYLPLVIMFHVLGLLWLSLSRDAEEQSAFTRAVLPSLVGGLIIFGFVAVPVFTGDAFRYRNAFKFTITKANVVDGEIRGEGAIEISKPGNYEFVTPRYSFAEYLTSEDVGSGLDVGTITWGSAGAPTAGKTGVFPLKIVWRKGVLPATLTALPDYENEVFLDVCDADDGSREIYFLSAPLKNQ